MKFSYKSWRSSRPKFSFLLHECLVLRFAIITFTYRITIVNAGETIVIVAGLGFGKDKKGKGSFPFSFAEFSTELVRVADVRNFMPLQFRSKALY
jgi:hypothetical protein